MLILSHQTVLLLFFDMKLLSFLLNIVKDIAISKRIHFYKNGFVELPFRF